MIEATLHIGVLYVHFVIAAAQSLKDKRMVLKRLKDQVHNTFNVSVTELDHHDKWQRSTMAFCMINSDNRFIDGALNKVLQFLEKYHTIEITEHTIEFY